jgi:hypothetical protein
VILCACGLRLDTQNDGLSLRQLKARLYACAEQHGIECTRPPTFVMRNDYGLDALCLVCAQCDALEIVM